MQNYGWERMDDVYIRARYTGSQQIVGHDSHASFLAGPGWSAVDILAQNATSLRPELVIGVDPCDPGSVA